MSLHFGKPPSVTVCCNCDTVLTLFVLTIECTDYKFYTITTYKDNYKVPQSLTKNLDTPCCGFNMH